ncbi:MAG: ribonuclease E inhibitor RraB [Flavobacteriaceae bacterium]|nr:ribonuclease E inhibitor RraB [Flavobacteriaceae bacterium]
MGGLTLRVDKVGYDEIDEYTLELWEKAQELNGDYDGWETSIEK